MLCARRQCCLFLHVVILQMFNALRSIFAEHPFPGRYNMDCLAVYLERIFFVNRYDCQLVALGCFRRLQYTFDFSLSCLAVRHVPRNLYQFIDVFVPLNYEVAFCRFLKIKNAVSRLQVSVQVQEYGILQQLAVVVALWKQYGAP